MTGILFIYILGNNRICGRPGATGFGGFLFESSSVYLFMICGNLAPANSTRYSRLGARESRALNQKLYGMAVTFTRTLGWMSLLCTSSMAQEHCDGECLIKSDSLLQTKQPAANQLLEVAEEGAACNFTTQQECVKDWNNYPKGVSCVDKPGCCPGLTRKGVSPCTACASNQKECLVDEKTFTCIDEGKCCPGLHPCKDKKGVSTCEFCPCKEKECIDKNGGSTCTAGKCKKGSNVRET